MNTFCMIRPGTVTDNVVTMILTLLSQEPLTSHVTVDETIIIFNTRLSIDICQEELENCCNDFVLIDMTADVIKARATISRNIERHMKQVFAASTTILLKRKTPEEMEQRIFDKINEFGTGSLTQKEHDFMQTRF